MNELAASWKDKSIQILYLQKREYIELGEVYKNVSSYIPLHEKCRRYLSKRNSKLKCSGRKEEELDISKVDSLDGGFFTFTEFILRYVERKSKDRYAKRSDLVRLKPYGNCQNAVCKTPLYLTGFGKHSARPKYCSKCLNTATNNKRTKVSHKSGKLVKLITELLMDNNDAKVLLLNVKRIVMGPHPFKDGDNVDERYCIAFGIIAGICTEAVQAVNQKRKPSYMLKQEKKSEVLPATTDSR